MEASSYILKGKRRGGSHVTEACGYLKSRRGMRDLDKTRSWLTSTNPKDPISLGPYYRLDVRFAYIVEMWKRYTGGIKRGALMCCIGRTMWNFEPGAWMMRLPCPRVQAKNNSILNPGSDSLSYRTSLFLQELQETKAKLRFLLCIWTTHTQKHARRLILCRCFAPLPACFTA